MSLFKNKNKCEDRNFGIWKTICYLCGHNHRKAMVPFSLIFFDMREKLLPIFIAVAVMSGASVVSARNVARMHPASTAKAVSLKQSDPKDLKPSQTLTLETFAKQPNPAKAIPSKATARHAVAADAEVLLYQDFSLMTEGSEEELGPDVVPNYSQGDMYIPEEYTGQEGWNGMGLYSAGGKVALAYPSLGGVINTPEMEMFGRLTVTTRVKVREGNSGSVMFYINCVKGSVLSPVAVNNIPWNQRGSAVNLYYQTVEDGWVDITTEFYNLYPEEDCWIQINATTYSKAGIMIDEIKIERDYEFCTAPSNLISYDFTNVGFTARWDPGYNNDSYLLSLWEERKDGENTTYVETFDNISVDENGVVDPSSITSGLDIWLGYEGPQASNDGGSDGSKCIILDSGDDFVAVPDVERPVTAASVYLKSEIVDGSYAMLYVVGISGYYSEIAGGIPLYTLTEGTTINLRDYIEDLSAYTCIGFQPYYLQPGESVMLDNLTWTVLAPTVTTQIREDMPVDSNIVVLSDLNPEYDYTFSVKGVANSGLVSDESAKKLAIGCPAPEALAAEDVEYGAYTARWNPSVKAESYMVRNFEQTTIKEDEDDYEVLVDSFSAAFSEAGMDYIEGSLDEMSDVKGWTAYMGIYSEMGVGTMYSGEIVSPPLNLSHNDGKFKVKVGAWLISECGMVIQCNTTSYEVILAPPSLSGDMELDYYEFEVDFKDGTPMSNLYIYSYDGNGYFLDSIEILQNVKAGDKEIVMVDAVEVKGHDSDSWRFADLEVKPDCNYAYTVTAMADYHATPYTSLASNLVEVDMPTGIEQMANNSDIAVYVDGLTLTVECPEATSISVYTSDGNVIASKSVEAGVFIQNLPSAGLYLVKAGNEVHKLMAF